MAEPNPVTDARDFLRCLQKSKVVEEAALEAFLQEHDARGEYPSATAVARELIQAGLLTRYQAKFLLAGQYKGLVVGRKYCILNLLGRGGMGAVYQARHRLMNRVVALKVIGKDFVTQPEAVERFRREIQIAGRLHHPNIVAAYDAEQFGGFHYLVMEYVDGITLADHVQRHGPIPVAEACAFLRQAAAGLQHAHEQGMVHRDIKPQNLMLTTVSGNYLVKILDFGLARFVQDSLAEGVTIPGIALGTPDFMAPEQARQFHATDIRGDIYSLGCTLYFLLTGRSPFPAGDTFSKLAQHALEYPTSLDGFRADIPPGLINIFTRMTAKRPGDRFQTPAEVVAAMDAGCQG